jgi:hypothetical protein
MTFPKVPLLVPATFCITTFLAMGCNLPDIDLDTNGDEDEDEDEEEEDTEGESDTDEPGISGGGVDSEGGEDPTATTQPWGESGGVDSEGFETESGYDTDYGTDTGGGNAGAGCVAYCEVELACGQYYASADECQTACAEELASVGECAPHLDAVNECLGTLGCEEYAAFWVAIDELLNTGETGPFPCDQPFMEFALCGSGGSGGTGGA